MKKFHGLMILVCLAMLIGCGGAPSETPAPPVEVKTAQAEESIGETIDEHHDLVYACGCGPDCSCSSVAKEPGTCSCGKELVQTHVVKIEGSEALLCTCGDDCVCEIGTDDATKCSCGNPVRRVSLEGTGLYFCNCGGSCTCNYIAAEAGECGCGMDLISST